MFKQWLRYLRAAIHGSGRSGRGKVRRRSAALRLEWLEDRLMPAHNITIAATGLTALPIGATTFSDTNDYTIAPSVFSAATGDIFLEANNDVTFKDAVLTPPRSKLSVQAGRSIEVQANVGTAGGDLVLTANEQTTGAGVLAANRDSGPAHIEVAGGVKLQCNGGDLQLTLSDGAGRMNNTSNQILFAENTDIASGRKVSVSATGAGVILGAGASLSSGEAMTLTTDFLDFARGSRVTTFGGARLLIQPYTPSRNILLGGSTAVSNYLTLTTIDVAALDTGFQRVTIGSAAGTGAISTQGDLTFQNNVVLQTGVGGITVTNTLDAGAHNLTLDSGGQVELSGGAELLSSGGTLSVNGHGTTHGYTAVYVSGATIDAGTGNISLTGTGADSSPTAIGVDLVLGAKVVTAESGSITLTGQGAKNTLGTAVGIVVGSGSLVQTVDGDLSLRGTGGASGGFDNGISLLGQVQALGRGNVSIVGQAGNGTNANVGLYLVAASVQTVDGNISLTGTGGGSGSGNYGILIDSGVTVQATGSGSITLQGTGAAGADAAYFKSSPKHGNRSSIVSGTGPITLIGDAMTLGDVSLRTTGGGSLILQPLSTDRPIILGGTTEHANALTLTTADLDAVAPGFGQLTIGRADGTGQISTAGDMTITTNVLIQNPGANSAGIVVSNRLDTAGHDLTLLSGGPVVGWAPQLLTHGGNVAITGVSNTTSLYGIYLDQTTLDAGTGDIHLTGSANVFGSGISLNNNTTVRTAGSGSIWAVGNALSNFGLEGIAIDRSQVQTANGSISLQGAATSTASCGGVSIEYAQVEATGSGSISIVGDETAPMGGTGVYLEHATVQTVDGSLAIQGSGAGSRTHWLNFGVDLENGAGIGSVGSGAVSMTGAGANAGVSFDGYGGYSNSIFAGTGDLTLTGDDIDLTGSNSLRSTGGGRLTLQPLTPDRNIRLGGDSDQADALTLTATDLAAIAPGFSRLTIGRDDGSGSIATVNDLTFNCDLLLQTPDRSSPGVFVYNTIDVGINNLTILSGGPVGLWGGDARLLSNGGDISITGHGNTAYSYAGVWVDEGVINAGTGNIQLSGQGVDGFGSGILIDGGAQVQTAGNGSLTLDGTGGDSVSFGIGVAIGGSGTLLQTADGDLHVHGMAQGHSDTDIGVLVGNAAVVWATGRGNVTITGEGGAGTAASDGNRGVVVYNYANVQTKDGDLTLLGTGGGPHTNGYGVEVQAGSVVQATGAGAVTLRGTGGAGSADNFGVLITDFFTVVQTAGGDLTLDGTSQGTGSSNYGVLVEFSAEVQTAGWGSILVIGQGGPGGADSSDNCGIVLNWGAFLHTTDGDVSLIGTGGGAGTLAYGVTLHNDSWIQITGSGSVSLTGTSGDGTTNNDGVLLTGFGTTVQTAAGNVTINGTGKGVGGLNHGLEVVGGATVSAGDAGSISLTGAGVGTGAFDIHITGTVQVASGALHLTADLLDLDGGSIDTTRAGSLTVQTRTARPIVLGAATDQADALTLTASDLAAVQPGFSLLSFITQGSAAISTQGDVTFANDVTLQTDSGPIDIGNNFDVSGHALTLRTAGAVQGDGVLTADLLQIYAGSAGSIAAPLATHIQQLVAQIAAGGLYVSNTGDLLVTVGGVTAPGDVSLTASGTLMIGAAIPDMGLNNVSIGDPLGALLGVPLEGTDSVAVTSTSGGTIILTADTIDLLNVNCVNDDGGQIVFQPYTPSRNLVVGGTSDHDGALTFTASDLAGVRPTYAQLTLGSAADTGTIATAGNLTFNSDVFLQTQGDITIGDHLDAGTHDLTLHSGGRIVAAGVGELTANTVTLVAPTGIGGSDHPLDLVANLVQAITNAAADFGLTLLTAPLSMLTAPSRSVNGALPIGLTFVDNGDGSANLAGFLDPTSSGVYTFSVDANLSGGTATTQRISLTVNGAPTITSPTAATFNGGSANSFTVATRGFPTPTLTESGTLPDGVTFVDNRDGTATLSGIPVNQGGSYQFSITASNVFGSDVMQSFTLTVASNSPQTPPDPAPGTQNDGGPKPDPNDHKSDPSPVTHPDPGIVPPPPESTSDPSPVVPMSPPASPPPTVPPPASQAPTVPPPTAPPPAPLYNFDKLGAYRPSDGSWSLDSDGKLQFDPNLSQVFLHFSLPGVTGVAGDWSGTGRDTIGDFSNGVWHLDINGNGVVDPSETFTFGQGGDQPVVGDWTGDGVSKLGVFRAAPDGVTGEFILDTNNDRQIDAGDATFTFGLATDRIVVGDWNGDGKAKVGVLRDAAAFGAPGAAVFSLDVNNNHAFDAGVDSVFLFGNITDGLVIGDWNGDGRSKVGVYRDGANGFNAPGTALFSLDSNGNMQFDPGVDPVFLYGRTTDQFVTGNWQPTPPLLPAEYAAGGHGPGGTAKLTAAQLAPVLQQAIQDWAAHGASAAQLESVPVRIAHLEGNLVGWTGADGITLDPDAAGWGWFADPTPGQDAAFALMGADGLKASANSGAAGKMDLLTVVEHELGHELGLNDVDLANHSGDLMASTLPTGTRRIIGG